MQRARTSRAAARDSYLALVQEFPLRPLRSERDLDRAVEMIDALLARRRLDAGERDYLDVLSDLVESYEEHHHPIEPASDAEMLAFLLDIKQLRQNDLASATGIASSTISEVLAGKRHLTRQHIEKLAAHFRVDPGVFLGGAA